MNCDTFIIFIKNNHKIIYDLIYDYDCLLYGGFIKKKFSNCY